MGDAAEQETLGSVDSVFGDWTGPSKTVGPERVNHRREARSYADGGNPIARNWSDSPKEIPRVILVIAGRNERK